MDRLARARQAQGVADMMAKQKARAYARASAAKMRLDQATRRIQGLRGMNGLSGDGDVKNLWPLLVAGALVYFTTRKAGG